MRRAVSIANHGNFEIIAISLEASVWNFFARSEAVEVQIFVLAPSCEQVCKRRVCQKVFRQNLDLLAATLPIKEAKEARRSFILFVVSLHVVLVQNVDRTKWSRKLAGFSYISSRAYAWLDCSDLLVLVK